MESRSPEFDHAAKHGGHAVYQVDAVRNGTLLLEDVPFLATPTVHVNGDAPIRRTLRGVVADPSLVPMLTSDPLSVYGTELHVRCGFALAGGDEMLPVGVFRVQDVVPRTDGTIEVQGDDRSVVLEEASLEEPWVVPEGLNLATAIHDLFDSGYPGLTYEFAGTTATAALTVFQEGTGRMSAGRKLAQAGGLEVFFNAAGRPVLRPVPDPTTSPSVWDYVPGPESLLISAANRQSGRPIRNVVVGMAEGAGIPTLRSLAEVTEAASPIHPAKIGRRVRPFKTTIAMTQEQLDIATAAELRAHVGRSEQLSFTAAPHPGHDAGDVVHVAEESLGIDVFAVLVDFGFDLDLLAAVNYRTAGRRHVA